MHIRARSITPLKSYKHRLKNRPGYRSSQLMHSLITLKEAFSAAREPSRRYLAAHHGANQTPGRVGFSLSPSRHPISPPGPTVRSAGLRSSSGIAHDFLLGSIGRGREAMRPCLAAGRGGRLDGRGEADGRPGGVRRAAQSRARTVPGGTCPAPCAPECRPSPVPPVPLELRSQRRPPDQQTGLRRQPRRHFSRHSEPPSRRAPATSISARRAADRPTRSGAT